MPMISQQMITDMARQRFQLSSLPQGTDRTKFANYIVSMSGAIAQSLDAWRRSAYLEGVRITAVNAIGGKLRSGVSIDQLIRAQAPAGWDAYSRAIAAGVHNQFQSFANDVSVPGLPWYPAFAAFPGPFAPPMPNVPTPLMTIAAVAVRHLKEGAITDMIYNKMPTPKPPCCKDVAIALAHGIEKAAFVWLSSQQVTLVMGKGPVPTFAPPYVPVGPVVMGDIIPTPGHIAS
jgi:hypothetical protein